MRSSRAFRAGSFTLALALSLLATACAADDKTDGASPSSSSADQSEDDARDLLGDALEDQEGKDERVLSTSDDDVIIVVEQTLSSQNAKARWGGSDLYVDLDGSAEDVTASSPCLALEAFLKDGEDAILSYGDGEIRCSER
ncbi:MAG: hypothetical protein Q4G35_01580 [Propionibacteriaceae bacterium]|nr:hypothetical protein [Propionibacteriaceae bacterium]